MSLRCPGEPIRRTGLPRASPATWILVLKPPRDRPRPWACAPLFAGWRRLHADALERWWSRSSATPDRPRAKAQRGPVQHAPFDPAIVTSLDGSVVAELLRQVPPASPRARHPQQGVQKSAVI